MTISLGEGFGVAEGGNCQSSTWKRDSKLSTRREKESDAILSILASYSVSR